MKRKEIVTTVEVPDVVVRKHTRTSVKEAVLDKLLSRVLELETDEAMEQWGELSRLAGYKDLTDVQAHNLALNYDSVGKTLTVYRMVDDPEEHNERLAVAWAKEAAGIVMRTRAERDGGEWSHKAAEALLYIIIAKALAGKLPEGNAATDDTDG